MAYVAISGKLLDAIDMRIRAMRAAEIEALGPRPNVSLTGSESYLLEVAWGEHLHLKDIIPKRWTGRAETMYLEFRMTLSGGESATATHYVGLSPGLLLPPNYRAGHGGPTIVAPPDVPELAELRNHYVQVAEIELRWNKVDRQVTKFLGECKSLNEALKLWPQLVSYIPKEYVDKVMEKREQTKTESRAAAMLAAGEVDTDGVTAAAVIARMVGAKI